MNSHSIPLRLAAADHAERAMGLADDDRIMHGIASTHLLIAAATPRAQLEALYARWNRYETGHLAHTLALCIVLEAMDSVMLPEGLVA